MIENDKRIGPAACREMGISAIETPYFLTVDAHMQFGQDDWCNAIIEQLKKKTEKHLLLPNKSAKRRLGD